MHGVAAGEIEYKAFHENRLAWVDGIRETHNVLGAHPSRAENRLNPTRFLGCSACVDNVNRAALGSKLDDPLPDLVY